MSATSSQPAIKYVTLCHLGTKWCGWFSTRPTINHLDVLTLWFSVVQFRPLIFHKSTACFRPMILSSVWTKNTQNCVYLSCFLRLFFVFSSCLSLFGFESSSIKVATRRKSPPEKCDLERTVYLHVIKVPHAAKKLDALIYIEKGWLVRTTLSLYSVALWRFRLSFVASKLTFTRNCTTSSGASGRRTDIQWSLFI